MIKRIKWLCFLAGVILVVALIVFFRRDREPSYQGRSLSSWVIDYQQESIHANEYQQAIAAMGTNALPYLLKWIQYHPQNKGGIIYDVNSFWFKQRGNLLIEDHEEQLANGSMIAFSFLGSATKIAMPELVSLANGLNATNHDNWAVAARAVYAIRCFGADGVPQLMNILANERNTVRNTAAYELGMMGTNAFPSIPMLIHCLLHADDDLPNWAAEALGNLRGNPDIVIPALISSLDRTNIIDYRVFGAFAKYGQLSSPAIPKLKTFLLHPRERFRIEATNALLKIAPELLSIELPAETSVHPHETTPVF